MTLETAPALWRHVVKHGGLQPEGWDAPLVNALRETLGLGAGELEEELANVSVERLTYALLGDLAPFAAMMSDLLSLFAKHGIHRSDGNAEIVFDFGAKAPPLAFDLETFRRTIEEWRMLVAPSLDASWLRTHAWSLHSLLREALVNTYDWRAPDLRHKPGGTTTWRASVGRIGCS